MHRLFLLTSYHKRGTNSLEEITALGGKLSIEEQQGAVHDNVHEQIAHISQAMDDILLVEPRCKAPAPGAAKEPKSRPSGLSFAVGQEAPKVVDPETLVPAETRPLSFAKVSATLKESIGYTLDLKPSQIDHKEAGRGVYLVGEVGPGTVVSFYPGIVYSPPQYRYMRGYPRMDIVNSYLVSRYDGLVIDGQSWGCGGESRELWDGSLGEVATDAGPKKFGAKPTPPDFGKKSVGLWGSVFGAKETHCARRGSVLERRNPLALAHFINHPAIGKQPNVMLCPYDFVFLDPNMRPYIPNVHFDDDNDCEMRRQGLVWLYDKKGENAHAGSAVIRTLVLVSTREVCNEELLLNYRLSNHKRWPTWYHPVDSEEDKRRWD